MLINCIIYKEQKPFFKQAVIFLPATTVHFFFHHVLNDQSLWCRAAWWQMSFSRRNKVCIISTAALTKTKALQDCSRVQDLLVNACQENKRMTLGRWKVRKWQTHSDSRCTAANNKLHCFTMTKKKKHKEAGGLLNEPNSCHCNKTWQTLT